MKVPFMDLRKMNDTEANYQALIKVMKSGQFIQGPNKREFEENFAKYCGAKHCIGVDSGTSALELSLKAMGIGPGDEVVTVPNTFYATAYAIASVGAKPVFVDVDPETYLMDPLHKINVHKNTKAFLPVHLYGQMVDMDKFKLYDNIPVIEDACQAHGAKNKGRRAGTLGNISAFSYYPGKNLGAFGDAGAVVTNDDVLAEKVRLLHEYGSPKKYHHDILGGNHRMDTIQAAVLNEKLQHLDSWNQQRREAAKQYDEQLKGIESIVTPKVGDNNEHIYHLYVIQHPKRDKLQQYLKEHEIDTGMHYPVPLHLTKAFEYLGYKKGSFPVSERLCDRILSLPMYPGITNDEISYVCDTIKDSGL